jgi:hypothetical protein
MNTNDLAKKVIVYFLGLCTVALAATTQCVPDRCVPEESSWEHANNH